MRYVILLLTSCLLIWSSASLCATNPKSSPYFLHLDWLDESQSPSQDFFLYANGSWQKAHPIPAAYASWNIMKILHEKNLIRIQKMLKTAANETHPEGSIEQKVGDFYFSGMNAKAINQEGVKALDPYFQQILKIQTLEDLQSVLAQLHQMGVSAVFQFGQMKDFKNSRQIIPYAMQAGLSLPDRSYYLEAGFEKIRQAYRLHLKQMFVLLGDSPAQATSNAELVLRLETALAQASLTRIQMRDPHAIYHPMALKQLRNLNKSFSWEKYFSDLGHPEFISLNIATPVFFTEFDRLLKEVSISDWKVYLRWHLIQSFAPFLSDPFVKENFKMASQLTGAKKLLPRWKRVVNMENTVLGFAVGQLYVAHYFTPEAKAKAQELIDHIRQALNQDLRQLSWMTPQTRLAALKKLDLMRDRVGYPDRWLDYSTLQIDRGSYVLNLIRAGQFWQARELNKIGKPLDDSEWDMPPQEVNAYYDPSTNRLNIPAGILQPPFFDLKAPDAINYGATGFVVGHEMTHGFDDEGSLFDGYGNLENWWSAEDLEKFHQTADAVATQFSGCLVNGKLPVQGKLVSGEAIADFGGLTLAYKAFHLLPTAHLAPTLAGYTPDQQFFLSAAHLWASNIRPEEASRLVVTDPHPPAFCRVNASFADMPEFQMAFAIPFNSPMVNSKRRSIW